MKLSVLTFIACLIVTPAYAKYSGGTGEPNDPYQIATAADLIALGETPMDYGKHFILTADIDLDPNRPGGRVFDRAVIAPDTGPTTDDFQGIAFTGVFDGNEHTIWHVTTTGTYYVGLFGLLGPAAEVRNLGVADIKVVGRGYVGGLAGLNLGAVTLCFGTGRATGDYTVGGLFGENKGPVSRCRSTCDVKGRDSVGGLTGDQYGVLTDCYSAGTVSGSGWYVGGLVGYGTGPTSRCYSVGLVRGGTGDVGGLVGYMFGEGVRGCFWDTQTSGQAASAAGTGKTTGEMRTMSTFLDAGWDFVNETANGTDDIWWIDDGKDYPRVWWEGQQLMMDD